MIEILYGIGAGLVFALCGLLFFAVLIGIGEVIDFFDRMDR